MRFHVYHIKDQIIEGSPTARLHSVKVQFNKSWLPTEIALKMYFMCGKKAVYNQSQNLEEDSTVPSLAMDKQLLTSQDQVIMPS